MKFNIEPNTHTELKQMMPFILVFNGVAAAVCIVTGLVFGFDWRVFSGLAVGNVLMLSNFVLIGYTADRISKCRDFRRGRIIGNASYGIRYVGIFVILAALLTIDAVALIPAVLPLFYPKIYYTFFYLKFNSRKEDE